LEGVYALLETGAEGAARVFGAYVGTRFGARQLQLLDTLLRVVLPVHGVRQWGSFRVL